MVVILRTRVKVEKEPVELEAAKIPKSAGNKRTKRRRKTDEEDDMDMDDDYKSATVKSIVDGRPFELVSELPSSLEVPQYNSALVHPLSVKDSGVLYHSLVTSRTTWTHGEMFDLYWTKPIKAKEEEAGDSGSGNILIREKMQKMCDAVMVGGPHTFPIRLFILKNEKTEQKWQQEQDIKKQEKEDRKKNEADEKKKRIDDRKHRQLQKKEEKEKKSQLQKEEKAKVKLEQEALKLEKKEEAKRLREKQKKQKKENVSVKPAKHGTLAQKKSSPSPGNPPANDPKMIANLNVMAQRDSKLNALMGTVAKGEASLKQVEEFKKFIEKAKSMPAPPGWVPPSTANSQVNKPISTQQELVKDKKLINASELKEEPKFNEKEVKNKELFTKLKLDGKNKMEDKQADNEQRPSDKVRESDKDQAKGHKHTNDDEKMTPKLDDSEYGIEQIKPNLEDLGKENSNDTEALTEVKYDSEKVGKYDNTIEVEEGIENSLETSEPKSEETTFSNEKEEEGIKVETGKTPVIQKRKYRKVKDLEAEAEEKELQLTAFQQKYVEESELVIEYQEYILARYTIPREAIIEYVEECDEFIFSWILVHNRKEVNRYKIRRIKELTKGIKDEEKKKVVIDEYDVYSERGCPTPLYTPMTVNFRNIHRKFYPIFLHCVDPIEKVQAIMSSILSTGTRLSGYNLWYQLDGYEDKDLAENLRFELTEHENGLRGKRHKK